MPAPVILLESSRPQDVPILTLDKSIVVQGFWTSATPAGFSNTIQILASGKVAGVLEPGESVTVPVYYAGMQRPWSLNEHTFQFDIQVYGQDDTAPVDWPSLQSSLQPSGYSDAAWNAIYPALTAQFGSTWGGYVDALDQQAAYLGHLGRRRRRCGPTLPVRRRPGGRALARVATGRLHRHRRACGRAGPRLQPHVRLDPDLEEHRRPARARLADQLAVCAWASPPTAP